MPVVYTQLFCARLPVFCFFTFRSGFDTLVVRSYNNSTRRRDVKAFTIDVIAPEKGSVAIEDGRWVANVDTLSHAEEYENSQRTLVREMRERTYTIIGPKPREQYLVSGRRTSNSFETGSKIVFEGSVWIVGDEPFGVISEVQKEGGREPRSKLFICSRQIQNGKVGEKPRIAEPLIAWQAPDRDEILFLDDKPFGRRTGKKRGKQSWASFEDVVRILNMDAVEVILRYFPFTRVNHPELQVFYALRCEEVNGRLMLWGSWEWVQDGDLLWFVSRKPSTVWIRPGFAMTMLYLHHFGYLPPLPMGFGGDSAQSEE